MLLSSSYKKPRIRASAICVNGQKLLTVLARDPVSRKQMLMLPGGEIEANETPVQAAVRETREEAGHEILARAQEVLVLRYDFKWAGVIYDCTTHFFPAILRTVAIPPAFESEQSDYLEGPLWIPIADVPRAFAYHTVIFQAVQAILSTNSWISRA